MNRLGVLAFATCAILPLQAAYVYDYANLLSPYNSGQWTANGTSSATTGMFTSTATNGGSLIFGSTVPGPASSYEVRTTLTLPSAGGTYNTYLRATSNSLAASGNTGTWYAIQIVNPSGGFATMNFLKSIAGTVTNLSTSSIPAHNGMVVRVMVVQGQVVLVYIDNALYLAIYDPSITTGQPGIGVASAPAGNGISAVDIGHYDNVAPNAVNSALVGTSVFANRVDMQWPGVLDDTNGIGVVYYGVLRNGGWISNTISPNYSDPTVSPSTTYTYTLQVVDYHFNVTTTNVTVTTPPAGSIDPRQVGVRSLGSYWGGGGEQIDMRSGNLNYTMPLLKAMARSGWGVGFSLSYNSQNWRQDPAGTWQLGRDLGYGYGFRMQAGSLTPIYTGWFTLHHYLFIDSTGAEYRLDQNSGGVWTSRESIYVSYDSAANRLYFNDGSFWSFGSTSAGTEQDAGTLYPTLMQDSNGNQITITYNTGVGASWANSSSRPQSIYDVRPTASTTYSFTYNSDPIPHLTGISNALSTAENYSFGYTSSATLVSPFNPANTFGQFKFLQTATATSIPLTTTFAYNASGSGELTQMTTPYGGHLRWNYVSSTLSGSRVFREVQDRYLSMSSGAAETQVSLYHDPGDNARPVHIYGNLFDFSGNANKVWFFQTDMSQPNAGLMFSYEEKGYPSGTVLLHQDYIWALTPTSLNPFINSTTTTLDYGQTYAASKKTDQSFDQYGNLVDMAVYDFGSLSSPARSYHNDYLHTTALGSNYAARYIFNRVVLSKVTVGSLFTNLATNSYDQSGLTDRPGILNHDASYTTTNIYRGNLTTSVTPTGTTTTAYDIGGNPTGSTSNGVTTSAAINSSTNFAAPSAITTNSLTTTLNYSSFLAPSSATGPNGDSMSISYTAARPTSTVSPTGATTTFTYDDSFAPYKKATTNGHWTKTWMDGFGRTIKVESGATSTTKSVVETVYAPCGCSPLGKLSKTSRPYVPGDPVYWTVNTYDASGRTTRVTLPDGSHTDYEYQSNTIKVTDPAFKWKKFTMDAMGNLTQVEEPDPTLGTVTTAYTYDILNHLTYVSMPRGANTQNRAFNYIDPATGRPGAFLMSATNPETGTVNYTYANGLLASKTDAKGQQLTYQYDSYHRLTSVTWANNPSGSQVLRTYYYDSNPFDSGFSQYVSGRLAAVQYTPLGPGANPTITLRDMYSYTQAGLPAIKRLQVNEALTWTYMGLPHGSTPSANLDVSYQYNYEGKVTSVTYPTSGSGAGATYNYSYDSMGRLYSMTDASGPTVVNSATYGPANELTTFSFWPVSYASATENRTYNTLGQMTNLTVTYPTTTSTQYTYPTGSNNGKISSQKINSTGEEVQYAYDSLNRLISGITTSASDANGNTPWGQNYGYDGFGNLTAKTVSKGSAPAMSVSVNPATNRITSVYNLTYDANGNVITTPSPAGTSTLTYDAENRMIATGQMNYGYDAQNKRFWSWDGSSVDSYGNLTYYNVFLYSPGGQKLATYQIAAVVGGSPPYTGSLSTALAASDKYFGGRRIQIEDRLSSTNGKFYPYGEDKPGNPASDNWKFATYWRDSQTNLDYADQRYFSSQYGRFTSPDPYKASVGPADPASWNRYTYTRGDPANRTDRTGLIDESDGYYGTPEDGYTYVSCTTYEDGKVCYADPGSGQRSSSSSVDKGAQWDNTLKALKTAGSRVKTQTFSQKCVDDIHAIKDKNGESLRTEDIRRQVDKVGDKLYNGTTSTRQGSFQYADGTIVYGTIGSFFNGGVANLGAYTIPDQDQIWFNPGIETAGPEKDPSYLAATMMHELIHTLGFNDAQIQAGLNIANSNITANISDTLATDCFGWTKK